jgi:hypothetical protein
LQLPLPQQQQQPLQLLQQLPPALCVCLASHWASQGPLDLILGDWTPLSLSGQVLLQETQEVLGWLCGRGLPVSAAFLGTIAAPHPPEQSNTDAALVFLTT